VPACCATRWRIRRFAVRTIARRRWVVTSRRCSLWTGLADDWQRKCRGLDVHYDLGEGHPLLGRRMPDLDLLTANGPLRFFSLLHDARPVLLNLGEPSAFDLTPRTDRVQCIHAQYAGTWELPAIGEVAAPTAVLIRPDGYVAWVGDRTQPGLADALSTWFGAPAAA